MFTKKTVFILGAGASFELGLPTGRQLIGLIEDMTTKIWTAGIGGWKHRDFAECLYELQKNSGEPNCYIHAAARLNRGISYAFSIDNFVGSHPSDDFLKIVGKLAIHRALLKAEREEATSYIYRKKAQENPDDQNNSRECWLEPFFHMLATGHTKNNLEGLFSNVSIISFNYDRCVVAYLAAALQNHFSLDAKQAEILASQLEVM